MSTSILTAPTLSASAAVNADRATSRDLAQPFHEFADATADSSDLPDRATRRYLAQCFGGLDDDPAACNGDNPPDCATSCDVAQPFSEFRDDDDSRNGTVVASERFPKLMHEDVEQEKEPTRAAPFEECDDLDKSADLEAPDATLLPSYTSPPLGTDDVDFKTPWDNDIERWQPPAELTEQQKTAIDMIISGKKLNTIAQQLDIHRGTLWRWRRHDLDFRTALDIARARAFQHAIDQLRELVPKAVDIVHSQLENADHRSAFQLLRLVVNVHRDALDRA